MLEGSLHLEELFIITQSIHHFKILRNQKMAWIVVEDDKEELGLLQETKGRHEE